MSRLREKFELGESPHRQIGWRVWDGADVGIRDQTYVAVKVFGSSQDEFLEEAFGKVETVGSGGKITLRFVAVGTGQIGLKLIYHRPFEKDAPSAQKFEVTVTVR